MPKATPGRPWKPGRAADTNAIQNAADIALQSRRNIDGDEPKRRQPEPCVMVVQNLSGVAKRQYEVCQIRRTKILTDFLPDQTRATGEDPWQGGITTGGAYNYLPRQMGIYLDPAPINAYARVQIAGICPALVFLTANSDNYCDVDFQEDRLISTVAGSIQIVQKPATVTGEQLCLVNLSRQEECHLVGIPQGNGISAYAGGVPGTGVVRLYFQKDGTLYDVVENGAAAYLTVYSLHDDPIRSNAAHSFGGVAYTPGYSALEYCLLHRDMYGTWWIDPMPHAKVAMLHLAGNIASISYPAAPTDYLARDTALGDGATGITNLDAALLSALAPADEADGVATVLLTGDYTVTISWSGGTYTSVDAPAISSWGYLGFAQVTLTLQYLPPGGAWTTLLTSAANRYTDRTGQYPDVTGGSYTKSVNLIAGTLLRCSVAIGVQYPSGTPTLAQSGLTATVNLIKHA